MSAMATRTGARPRPATQCTAMVRPAGFALTNAALQMPSHFVMTASGGGSPSGKGASCAAAWVWRGGVEWKPARAQGSDSQGPHMHLDAELHDPVSAIAALGCTNDVRDVDRLELAQVRLEVSVRGL